MAVSLHSTFLSLKPPIKPLTKPPATAASAAAVSIRCGPRSNRGPLVKGRILSSEAILAVQQLKRAYRKSQSPPPATSTTAADFPDLSRLIKSDLLAVLRELLRQDLCHLALHVLSALRSEFPGQIDLNLYGEVISALWRNKLPVDMDRLIEDLERDKGGIEWETDKGLLRVVRGVVEAGRRESAVRIYRMMKDGGCGDTWPADEYVVGVLSRGLKRMGEVELGIEVYKEFGGVYKGKLDKVNV